MSRTPVPTPILVFGPLTKTSSTWDYRELRSALLAAINCQEVPGPTISPSKLEPRYITIPLNQKPINGIALHRKNKSTPGLLDQRLPLLVKFDTGQPGDGFKRALECKDLWVSCSMPYFIALTYCNRQLLYFDQIPENSE